MRPIEYNSSALKTLRRIPKNIAMRIVQKVELYAHDPTSQARNVKRLKGYENVVRLRVGDWPVIMVDENVIEVIKIGSRGSIYEH